MYFPPSRRGRPRYERQKLDKGTPELQHKRKQLLQKDAITDVSLAESLLGILYARHMVSRPLYEAGCFFGEIGYQYRFCLGYSFRPFVHDLALRSGEVRENQGAFLSEYQIQKRTKAWYDALDALRKAGPCPYKIVLKVVFYDQDLYTEPFPRLHLTKIKDLRKGLERLDRYFKEGPKGSRDSLDDSASGLSKSTTFPLLLNASPPLFLL